MTAAQQLLVGWALTAGLRARQVGPDERKDGRVSPAAVELISQIDQVRREILELIDGPVADALRPSS